MPQHAALLLLSLVLLAGAPARADGAAGAGADAEPRRPSVETELRLEALGYSEHASNDPDPSRRGVTRNDADAIPGVNYYCTGSTVRFLAMDGTVLHETPLQVGASPGSGCLAELYRRAEVLAIASPLLSMVRLAGQPRWIQLGPYHHDVGIDGAGLLYALRKLDAAVGRGDRLLPITGQAVDVLDGKGRRVRSIDLSPILAPLVTDERLARIAKAVDERDKLTNEEYAQAVDVFHPNTIEIVDWPHAPGGGRRALIGLRQLDRVAVVDLDERKLLWEWGAGEIVGPHDPWLLPNGNVLLFDNGAKPTEDGSLPRRLWSRVVEVDPRDGKIVWQYRGEPPASFFSATRGGAQPLGNGNVLITETTKGHVFEVTRAGRIVWEFWNTDFDEGARRSIYRMRRIPLDVYRALRGLADAPRS
jgi:hypothetical protein